ncbi:MAG: ADP-ribosylglycohydrolase family protein [Chloroflexota bacterium]|nr:ADP-ribosylglycohydrolase family protein [Chloroflexota bacterium]
MFSRILGGLYGQALGDAWAMPAMLTPQDTWKKYGGWITEFLPGPEDHPVHAGLLPGQVTDDTEQAFSLAEAVIQDSEVTVEGAARAIVTWYDRIGGDDCPYVGPSTRRAVQAIKRGEDLNITGRWGDTNGAAMKISPIGLMHPGDLLAAVEDARIACTPTHNTDVAISGAAAVAGAIAVAMKPGSTLDKVIQAGKEAADIGRAYGHRWMGASVSRRIALAVDIARSALPPRERIQEMYEMIGTSLAIPESVPAAFGVLVMAEGDPKQAAIYAAALSGDADTIAAMACAIAGAWRGAEVFDDQDIQKLRQVNPELDFDGVANGIARLVDNE